MPTQEELENIKRKILSRAIASVKHARAGWNNDSLVTRHSSAALSGRREEYKALVAKFDLTSRKDSDVEALQTCFQTHILKNVLEYIQHNHLPDYYEQMIKTENILDHYAVLSNKIRTDYDSVIRLSSPKAYDKWGGADVIITSESFYTERETLDISMNRRGLLLASNSGNADLVVVLENPNPLTWLFCQLRDAGLSYDKYAFYYDLAASAKHFIANQKGPVNHQDLLLCCIKTATDLHQQIKQYGESLINDFICVCNENGIAIHATGKIQRLKSDLLAYLSRFRMVYSSEDDVQPALTNVTLSNRAVKALPHLEAYLKLCDLPYSRSCASSIQLETVLATDFKRLLWNQNRKTTQHFTENHFTDVLITIDRIHFARKVSHMVNAGRHEAGWKLDLTLSDEINVDLSNVLGTYSKTDPAPTYSLYFKDETSLTEYMVNINQLKQLI